VDDTTISETVLKHEASSIQSQVNEFTRKSTANKFQLNEEKCKELQITFARPGRTFTPVYVNNKPIEVVPSAKYWACELRTILNGIPTSLPFNKIPFCSNHFEKCNNITDLK
jgi:hypothetical protein